MAGFVAPPPTLVDPYGFAVGVLADDELSRRGVRLQQFRWVYGPDLRETPFEAHRALRGRFMTAEGTLDGWWPGDHRGCLCDAEPLYVRV